MEEKKQREDPEQEHIQTQEAPENTTRDRSSESDGREFDNTTEDSKPDRLIRINR